MGGNIFKKQGIEVSPINKQDINTVVQDTINLLADKASLESSSINYTLLGSTGKKDISNDIDLGVDYSVLRKIVKYYKNQSKDEFQEIFNKFKKRARTSTDEELENRAALTIMFKDTVSAPNIYGTSIVMKNGADNIQVDIIFGDLEYLEFIYFGTSSEEIKGLHRTQLLLSFFDSIGYSLSHTKGLYDRKNKTYIKDLKEIISIFNVNFRTFWRPKDFTFNNLLSVLFYTNKEEKILAKYFKILGSTRTDIPKVLRNKWLNMNYRYDFKTSYMLDDSWTKGSDKNKGN